MTEEELAKHWNVSLDEVKSISDFMNKNYCIYVGQNKKDKLFYGLMYRMDEKHGPMLAVSAKNGCKTAKEAAVFFNNACDTMEMPKLKAELMGVPADAYKTLKKIDTSTMMTEEKTYMPSLERGARD